MNVELAEILGLLCAEGHLVNKRYDGHLQFRIEFYSKDTVLLQRMKYLLKKVFNYEVKITNRNKINIGKRAIVRDIISYTSLGHLSWVVPEEIIKSSYKVKIAFIRGFFDGDGSIYSMPRFFSTNKYGLKQVSGLLKDLEYVFTCPKPQISEGKKPLYSVQISRSEKARFLKEIGPSSKLPD